MNDGDKALVIQDEPFCEIAKRNMEGIVPLYYEMESANAEIIKNERIYDSLLMAFKANIGEVSNNITKVFNSDNIDLRVVKWLTAENNYIIDFAKTLYMPKRPDWANEIIKKYIKSKTPYFFIDAKDKERKNVEPLNNSTVNRLRKIVPNKRIKFEEIAGHFDYRMLMSEEVKNVNRKVVDAFRKLDRSKKWLIRDSEIKNRNERMLFVYKRIKEELRKIEPDDEKVVNILIEELYGRSNAPIKTTLWNCYGNIILINLRENLKGTKQCECCGSRVDTYNTKKYCEACAKDKLKEQVKMNMRKYRKRKKRYKNESV